MTNNEKSITAMLLIFYSTGLFAEKFVSEIKTFNSIQYLKKKHEKLSTYGYKEYLLLV